MAFALPAASLLPVSLSVEARTLMRLFSKARQRQRALLV